MSPFSKQERKELLNELNSQFPELINFSDDGYFDTVIVIAAKNYVLWDSEKNKLKIKGASLKATMKEQYLKDFINQVIKIMLNPDFKIEEIIELYDKTAKECLNLTDMSRHSKKKTISEKVLKGDGKAELRTRLALKGVPYQQGDKFKLFYLENGDMCLESNFKGQYCRKTLLKKLYATINIFESILPIEHFTNYSLQINYYPLLGIEKPKKSKKTIVI
jgi:DNA polymerase elongation subunit (family B)